MSQEIVVNLGQFVDTRAHLANPNMGIAGSQVGDMGKNGNGAADGGGLLGGLAALAGAGAAKLLKNIREKYKGAKEKASAKEKAKEKAKGTPDEKLKNSEEAAREKTAAEKEVSKAEKAAKEAKVGENASKVVKEGEVLKSAESVANAGKEASVLKGTEGAAKIASETTIVAKEASLLSKGASATGAALKVTAGGVRVFAVTALRVAGPVSTILGSIDIKEGCSSTVNGTQEGSFSHSVQEMTKEMGSFTDELKAKGGLSKASGYATDVAYKILGEVPMAACAGLGDAYKERMPKAWDELLDAGDKGFGTRSLAVASFGGEVFASGFNGVGRAGGALMGPRIEAHYKAIEAKMNEESKAAIAAIDTNVKVGSNQFQLYKQAVKTGDFNSVSEIEKANSGNRYYLQQRGEADAKAFYEAGRTGNKEEMKRLKDTYSKLDQNSEQAQSFKGNVSNIEKIEKQATKYLAAKESGNEKEAAAVLKFNNEDEKSQWRAQKGQDVDTFRKTVFTAALNDISKNGKENVAKQREDLHFEASSPEKQAAKLNYSKYEAMKAAKDPQAEAFNSEQMKISKDYCGVAITKDAQEIRNARLNGDNKTATDIENKYDRLQHQGQTQSNANTSQLRTALNKEMSIVNGTNYENDAAKTNYSKYEAMKASKDPQAEAFNTNLIKTNKDYREVALTNDASKVQEAKTAGDDATVNDIETRYARLQHQGANEGTEMRDIKTQLDVRGQQLAGKSDNKPVPSPQIESQTDAAHVAAMRQEATRSYSIDEQAAKNVIQPGMMQHSMFDNEAIHEQLADLDVKDDVKLAAGPELKRLYTPSEFNKACGYERLKSQGKQKDGMAA